ncbi:MAG: hypothetical protein J5995_07290 [Muribaculaceae bacterium]|nr:hypothetical protein [Muribaculaceae bacterium]
MISYRSIILPIVAACAIAQAAAVMAADVVPDSKYYQLADSARFYIARERWSDAARCTREALRLEPANAGNVMLFSNLGLASGMEGKFGEAMQCFDIALERAPRSIPVLTAKAKVQVMASDADGALATLDTILKLDSVAEWPLQTRGLLRLRQRDFKEAAEDFLAITRLYPENSWGPGGMAKCMEAQGYVSEAAGYYDDAARRCPEGSDDRVEFQLGLIENLGHIGKIQEALDAAKEAIAEHPHDGRLYLLRGWLKRKIFLNREAEADRKLAINYGVDPQIIEQFLPD